MTDPFARPKWYPTLDELKVGTPVRDEIEDFFEAWLDGLDRGFTYDDLMDRLDGTRILLLGVEYEVALPEMLDDPVYVRLVNIAKRVRREMNA